MSLDPAAKSLLDLINSLDTVPMAEMTPQMMRGGLKLPADENPVVMAKVEDVVIVGSAAPINARVYVPHSELKSLPLCLFYHGGGFVVGDLVDYDSWCRRMADKAGAIIISVNYALAPEYKFPQGPDDCYQALLWSEINAEIYGGDKRKIAVMGTLWSFGSIVCKGSRQICSVSTSEGMAPKFPYLRTSMDSGNPTV
jgi:acetyl esterase